MKNKIKVAAVSYLNTKPLLFGLSKSDIINDLELVVDFPSRLASMMQNGEIDLALLPVAAIPSIPGARIVSDYGIASDGNVASVAIFSQVPMEEIQIVYLDYQSRTSVRLAQLLLELYWKKNVAFKQASENYIDDIKGSTAGVIIGDRALSNIDKFNYVYDLSKAWKDFSGLDFIFAAWVANKDLPQDFIRKFNEMNAYGLHHLDEVVKENPFNDYDLYLYYTENIKFVLDEDKRKGLQKFLELIK